MGLIILLLVIFIIVIFVTRIRIVPQANVYVVERLGAFYGAPVSTFWYRSSTAWQSGFPLRNRS